MAWHGFASHFDSRLNESTCGDHDHDDKAPPAALVTRADAKPPPSDKTHTTQMEAFFSFFQTMAKRAMEMLIFSKKFVY
jgi:hypothetical protein